MNIYCYIHECISSNWLISHKTYEQEPKVLECELCGAKYTFSEVQDAKTLDTLVDPDQDTWFI